MRTRDPKRAVFQDLSQVKDLEARILSQQNPLFRAGILALEGGPDARAIADLEDAAGKNKDDRDLSYLLGILYKKAGRYDDSAAVYRELLQSDAQDTTALNNLANVEFAQAEYGAAIARYKQGIQSTPAGVCFGPRTITVDGTLIRLSTPAAMRPEYWRPAWGIRAASQGWGSLAPATRPSTSRRNSVGFAWTLMPRSGLVHSYLFSAGRSARSKQ